MKIAIVDDDPDILQVLTDALALEGFRVTAFEHGEQFIDWAYHSDEPGGLVLSDVNLAGC